MLKLGMLNIELNSKYLQRFGIHACVIILRTLKFTISIGLHNLSLSVNTIHANVFDHFASEIFILGLNCSVYGKPIVAIFNNLIYIQFSIYIYVTFFLFIQFNIYIYAIF